ncbi:cytochrome P450 [Apiospora sp. TS-2023a]
MSALLRPAVLGPVLAIISYVLYQILRSFRTKLPDLPIVGAKPGEWFPLPRARWRNAINIKATLKDTYRQYRHQACFFPVAGDYDYVYLPREELQWLLDQPDSSVSMHERSMDILQTEHTVMEPELVRNPVHHDLVKGIMTRETGNLVPDLFDEIQHSVGEFFGSEPDVTKEITVYATVQHLISRITNRVFVGLPLCRNEELLKTGIAFAMDIPITANILKFVWRPLRPLAALVLALPNRIHTNRFIGILRPEVERRVANYDARKADPDTKAAEKVPNDFLQWSINQAKASGDPYLCRTYSLASRVLLLNFASIHTSSFAMTHVLFDLAANDPAYIEELRHEIKTVLAENNDVWDKRILQKMLKLDSTMRESGRMNSMVTFATSRLVINPKGITTPSGVHIPPGVVVSGPSYPVLHDEEIYPDPHTFKPFRFAEIRQQAEGSGAEEKGGSSTTYVQRARQAFATTSPEYVAFGHGRHACPGRFFAATELKLMLAYIILNYDIEQIDERPSNTWFSANRVPPMKETLKVTRRTEI